MKEYYKQIKVLTAFSLIAFAVLLIFACFSPRGKVRLKNTPAVAVTSEKSVTTTKAETSKKVSQKRSETTVFDDFPININTADVETLINIPGIGQAKANEIVAYRNANGNFKSAEDLLNVYGISEATLEKIYGYITV